MSGAVFSLNPPKRGLVVVVGASDPRLDNPASFKFEHPDLADTIDSNARTIALRMAKIADLLTTLRTETYGIAIAHAYPLAQRAPQARIHLGRPVHLHTLGDRPLIKTPETLAPIEGETLVGHIDSCLFSNPDFAGFVKSIVGKGPLYFCGEMGAAHENAREASLRGFEAYVIEGHSFPHPCVNSSSLEEGFAAQVRARKITRTSAQAITARRPRSGQAGSSATILRPETFSTAEL